MEANHDLYTVFPAYCVPEDAESFTLVGEQLRAYLLEDLNARLGPEETDELIADSATLADILAEGVDHHQKGEESWIVFDVTRYGCNSSSLTVYAGDRT